MPVSDPISDMLTRIRNAVMVHHSSVSIPASKTKESLLNLLKQEGFISDFKKNIDGSKTFFEVTLRYYDDNSSVITGLKRISKPGCRVYAASDNLPRVLNGLGISILTTSKGVVSNKKAKQLSVGGEVLCHVW